jgi:hypothetical protein
VLVIVLSGMQLLQGGHDDFNVLLYIFRCCEAARDPRTWCKEFFIHQRVLRNGTPSYPILVPSPDSLVMHSHQRAHSTANHRQSLGDCKTTRYVALAPSPSIRHFAPRYGRHSSDGRTSPRASARVVAGAITCRALAVGT